MSMDFEVKRQWFKSHVNRTLTLASGIDVGPIFLNLGFFQALQPYQREHKGCLDGYLLHRKCVF